MKNCFQFENINMMDHGNMVHDYYTQLYNNQTSKWDFGKVDDLIKKLIGLASSPESLRLYHVYHDCGKPRCRLVDEQGRQHFPDHAQASYDTWIDAGGDEETAWYILHDMDFHILKGNDLEQLAKDPRAINLLLTAWSEIHANSQMFGGTESTSFKIKRKHLEKATKLLVSAINI